MACVNCGKIRAAILHGKMAEAAGLTIDALREKLGLSVQGEPLIDAAALPSLSGKNKTELLAIAAEEGAEISEGATNVDIVEAIEARRAVIVA